MEQLPKERKVFYFFGSSAELVGNYGLKRGSSQSIQGVKRQG
jgi:hypothetical protein